MDTPFVIWCLVIGAFLVDLVFGLWILVFGAVGSFRLYQTNVVGMDGTLSCPASSPVSGTMR
jgi:hypothetical protein